jgi:hypothetical protein
MHEVFGARAERSQSKRISPTFDTWTQRAEALYMP